MARGDFRDTPRYQFWATIIVSILFGIVLVWMLKENGLFVTTSRLVITFAGIAVISWFFRRTDLIQAPTGVEPYEHPILGLYAGLAAAVTLLFLDEPLVSAVLWGVTLGVVFALIFAASRRWRTRNDTDDRQRPIPTVTGWR